MQTSGRSSAFTRRGRDWPPTAQKAEVRTSRELWGAVNQPLKAAAEADEATRWALEWAEVAVVQSGLALELGLAAAE
jgi:hypothetical protein